MTQAGSSGSEVTSPGATSGSPRAGAPAQQHIRSPRTMALLQQTPQPPATHPGKGGHYGHLRFPGRAEFKFGGQVALPGGDEGTQTEELPAHPSAPPCPEPDTVEEGTSTDLPAAMVDEGTAVEPVEAAVDEGTGTDPLADLVSEGTGPEPTAAMVDEGTGPEPTAAMVDEGTGPEPTAAMVDEGTGAEPAAAMVDEGTGPEPLGALVEEGTMPEAEPSRALMVDEGTDPEPGPAVVQQPPPPLPSQQSYEARLARQLAEAAALEQERVNPDAQLRRLLQQDSLLQAQQAEVEAELSAGGLAAREPQLLPGWHWRARQTPQPESQPEREPEPVEEPAQAARPSPDEQLKHLLQQDSLLQSQQQEAWADAEEADPAATESTVGTPHAGEPGLSPGWHWRAQQQPVPMDAADAAAPAKATPDEQLARLLQQDSLLQREGPQGEEASAPAAASGPGPQAQDPQPAPGWRWRRRRSKAAEPVAAPVAAPKLTPDQQLTQLLQQESLRERAGAAESGSPDDPGRGDPPQAAVEPQPEAGWRWRKRKQPPPEQATPERAPAQQAESVSPQTAAELHEMSIQTDEGDVVSGKRCANMQ